MEELKSFPFKKGGAESRDDGVRGVKGALKLVYLLLCTFQLYLRCRMRKSVEGKGIVKNVGVQTV